VLRPFCLAAYRALRATAVGGAYLSGILLSLAAAGLLIDRGILPAAETAGSQLMLQYFDKSSDSAQSPDAHTGADRAVSKVAPSRLAAGHDFDHARPAPMFVTKSAAQIEQLKDSVVEHVVAADSTPWHRGDQATFRTLCVRLCDGAYFQVSFSTTRSHFARDEAACKSRCGAPARLFVHSNPGGSPETMTDLSGHSYMAIPTAFAFRKGRQPGCSCRPEPWQTAERDRHRLYALLSAKKEGKPVDHEELHRLRRVVASRDSVQARVTLAPPAEDAESARETVTDSFAAEIASAPESQVPAPTKVALSDQVPLLMSPSKVLPSQTPSAEPPVPVFKGEIVASTAPAGEIEQKAEIRQAARRNAHHQLRARRANASMPTRIWGIGPNAISNPKGDTVYDVFARNFY